LYFAAGEIQMTASALR